jgi:hypothetical protein
VSARDWRAVAVAVVALALCALCVAVPWWLAAQLRSERRWSAELVENWQKCEHQWFDAGEPLPLSRDFTTVYPAGWVCRQRQMWERCPAQTITAVCAADGGCDAHMTRAMGGEP